MALVPTPKHAPARTFHRSPAQPTPTRIIHRPPTVRRRSPLSPNSVPAAASSQPTTSQDTPIVCDIPFDHPELQIPLIKIIPKSSRASCGQILSKILSDIAADSTRIHRWNDLLMFGSKLLAKSARGGKNHNLGNLINKRSVAYNDPASPIQSNNRTGHKQPRRDGESKESILAAAVTSKIEDGNLQAAIRLICSDDAVTPHNAETLALLESKHPKALPDRELPARPRDTVAFQVTCDAIRLFPAGSSGGPDGITPRHLLDLTVGQHVADSLLPSLTVFVNLLLRGDIPEIVRPIILGGGGKLIAVQKKTGGVRPIATGYVWRRLAAKCASRYATIKLAPLLSPLQLGIGVPNGCEAAVHSARRFVESLHGDRAFIKLDFANAFNSLRRDSMLQSVSSELPELFDFCKASYGITSILKFGTGCVQSQEGAQQGDPLGPPTVQFDSASIARRSLVRPTHRLLGRYQSGWRRR